MMVHSCDASSAKNSDGLWNEFYLPGGSNYVITSTKVVLGIVVSITRNEYSKCAFEVLYFKYICTGSCE